MAEPIRKIESPDEPAWELLERELRLAESGKVDGSAAEGYWPRRQLRLLAEAGVFEWFLPREWYGQAWSDAQLIEGLMRLGSICLTTTFIVTQRTAACTRLAASDNPLLHDRYARGLADGSLFATVAISHLTTSRRHLGQAILRAEPTADGYCLNGYSAWVTGATHADLIVVGATLDDGLELMLAIDPWSPGFRVGRPEPLLALAASQTGRIDFQQLQVGREQLVAGPCRNVMNAATTNAVSSGPEAAASTPASSSKGLDAISGESKMPGTANAVGGSGGLQTSALALGLADAALQRLEMECRTRGELRPSCQALRDEWQRLRSELLQLAQGQAHCSREQVRSRANSLVLRATQASLAAAKGTGFLASHPAGRWCREALFFLVWSCPQAVMEANLCQLAMLDAEE
jgi:alkylation response protein AidB-like acyl-CoA dehydrogenase